METVKAALKNMLWCPGTDDAAGDTLMNWCVHASDLMGAVCAKQAETCTLTLQH